ncbi:hypothetical protein RISK_001581 [Rhodopirellula islandica]|uniref:Uncharacterized protein n=1 Tax=Rhodopirellula islandica TaxID=595434 RepID=A0A0J1BIJ7_RHOIS|nr:hypothetical protein RISK_001581 [Rhodopirellula islandica]
MGSLEEERVSADLIAWKFQVGFEQRRASAPPRLPASASKSLFSIALSVSASVRQ